VGGDEGRAMKWGWLAASAALPASMLMAAGPSPFDGIPDIGFEYYEVEGRTPQEIYESMRARAPRKSEGLAHTIWNFDVTWEEARHGTACRVVEPSTRMSIRIILPRLTETAGLTPAGRSYWRKISGDLEAHEAGHARIAWEHRDDFNRAALRASCASVERIARDVRARIDAIQRAYDRDTDHGRRQTPEEAVARRPLWPHGIPGPMEGFAAQGRD
jgi:predicted secreted Zn-dependent protease